MSTAVEPDDWACIDPWWSAYAKSQPLAWNSTIARALDKAGWNKCWDNLDSWWPAYTDSSPVVQDSPSTRGFVIERLTDSWDELDPWWDVYTETGHAAAVEIADILDRSNEVWRQSDSQFDTDPLAADLTLNRPQRGPLQPSNEMGWSRWLAQLLRPSEELVTELFDVEVDRPPVEVVREDQLSKQDGADGSFRRPDILVFHTDRGVSIEVKLGDENYRKTAETARLIEQDYNEMEWTHGLLLPKTKNGRLDSIVRPQVEQRPDGQVQIEWDDPGPVSVINWRDVTAATRSLLLRGTVVDDHWAANAYLFCAVAEQQLMGFQPQTVVKRLADPASVVDTIQPIRLAASLGEQLTYLRARQQL
jgi:hypothetical protein